MLFSISSLLSKLVLSELSGIEIKLDLKKNFLIKKVLSELSGIEILYRLQIERTVLCVLSELSGIEINLFSGFPTVLISFI